MQTNELYLSHLKKMDQRLGGLTLPEFPSLTWFNTPPLNLRKDLSGKILLFFCWRMASLECLDFFNSLLLIANKYNQQPFLLIGIHEPLYAVEKIKDNVLHFLNTHQLSIPVIQDINGKIWKQWHFVNCPSFYLIGPKNNLLYSSASRKHLKMLDSLIFQSLTFYEKELSIEKPLIKSVLSSPPFKPSKIATSSHRLFISDPGNHRIMACSFDGQVQDILADHFKFPQGVVYKHNQLYIADSGNHCIQSMNENNQDISLFAQFEEGSYPWDLAISSTHLFVLLAGLNQLISIDIQSKEKKVLLEHLNQPMGLCISDHYLYITNTESHGVIQYNLENHSHTYLIGGSSIHFGDRDAIGKGASIQHPEALSYWEDKHCLIIADTFNHRLKCLNLETHYIERWIGSGKKGQMEGSGLYASFNQPTGLAWHPNKQILYIVDSANHIVRVLDCKTEKVTTFPLKF